MILRSVIKLCTLSILSFCLAQPAMALVARAQFANDVVDREPINDIGDTIKVMYGEIQRVYFFTDLRDMSGHTILHRWLLDGVIQAELPFDIGGDRWRVWSSKKLMPGFDGQWTVEVVDDGLVIESRSFNYVDDFDS
ncbi:DUF2914 domain-containing protein [Marinomonas sp. 15G1-11]|uniref:DUF2914 domain-containing protein n=1 Tax=Marinomonas phaeophyticola TaxID=3004091 RepID=A0ABT4JSI8_9GAMM|nr:DUF2914 domain-containing protein [Marinomonas sp. 15G1-11]MCZ2721007.1 DUF2914 domain-containing protein [Marinomonas sp. 15G1-11]